MPALTSQTTHSRPTGQFCCTFCAGNGYQPTPFGGIEPCHVCDGTGYAKCSGDLGPSRSEKKRPYHYEPGCRRLTLVKGRKATVYTVSEFSPDREFPGRAFQLVKEDGEVYSVLIGHEGCICDCAGATYEAVAKANRRAMERGESLSLTGACKHIDVLSILLRDGWLDLPEAVPASPLVERFARAGEI